MTDANQPIDLCAALQASIDRARMAHRAAMDAAEEARIQASLPPIERLPDGTPRLAHAPVPAEPGDWPGCDNAIQVEADPGDADRWFVRAQNGHLVVTCYLGDGGRERMYLSYETFDKIAAAVDELRNR